MTIMTYEPAIHSSYFRTIPAKGQLISTAKLACRKPWYTKDCSGLIEELWWPVSGVKRPLTGVVWKLGEWSVSQASFRSFGQGSKL
ncbi:hypothetical protein AVEN_189822-1 [Araneus ventricosus]|uniref:Uncharacterized protein n=1 Tax=Araneus ventricosus TaxID=182803 RepID=A0A4Y2NNS5_ARAVE|nr:hypothetical protein AVEN_189822-1 [Araneus ventricosus]